jgi:hypothetical protein
MFSVIFEDGGQPLAEYFRMKFELGAFKGNSDSSRVNKIPLLSVIVCVSSNLNHSPLKTADLFECFPAWQTTRA